MKLSICFRAQSLPVVKIIRCSGISLRKGQDKKDPSSKGLRRRLSRATSKLFNRKSIHATHPKDAGHHEESISEPGKGKVGGIDNLGANIVDPAEGRAVWLLNDLYSLATKRNTDFESLFSAILL